MKKTIILFIMLFCFSCSYMNNEPTGFRGIPFGSDIKNIKDLSKVSSSKETSLYIKKDDIKSIGNAEIKSVQYAFYDDLFYSVMIDFDTLNNFQILKESLSKLHGFALQGNIYLDEYLWIGKQVNIKLDYSDIKKRGYILYTYKPILNKKQATSKSPEKDL